MKEFLLAKKGIALTIGKSLRTLRELRELSQAQLSALTGIPRSTISAIENGRVQLAIEHARLLARALHCHPALLVISGWEMLIGRRR